MVFDMDLRMIKKVLHLRLAISNTIDGAPVISEAFSGRAWRGRALSFSHTR